MSSAGIQNATLRDVVTAGFEHAESDDGKYRIKGVANTFGLMRSGRIIDPRAFDDWAKKADGNISIPIMVQHGAVSGLATVGRVDFVSIDPAKGLRFEAVIASGTQQARDVQALIEEGILGNISIGWRPYHIRHINVKDADEALANAMRERRISSAELHLKAELVEISIVDVPDDPGARIGASASAKADQAEPDDIETRVLRLETAVETMQETLYTLNDVVNQLRCETEAGFEEANAEFIDKLRDVAMEAVLDASPIIGEAEDAIASFGERYSELGARIDQLQLGQLTLMSALSKMAGMPIDTAKYPALKGLL